MSNSEGDSIMPCTVKSSFKTGLQIFLSKDKSYCIKSKYNMPQARAQVAGNAPWLPFTLLDRLIDQAK